MDKRIQIVNDKAHSNEPPVKNGMDVVWRLTLDCWSFKEQINAEPRLQRHVVVLKKAKRRVHNLLKNKQATGREKDKMDAKWLKKSKRG
ncbi:MAG: hypothetical protein HZA50_02150 [Planctomycetes bacterium]|nr:hypothetical protein [Planctomycetota bacterium]